MGVYVVNGDIALLYQILNENVFQSNILCPREYVQLPATSNVDVLSRYKGTLQNRFLKPSSTITLNQNTVYFVVSTAATSSASVTNYETRLWKPTSKLTRPLVIIMIYDNTGNGLVMFILLVQQYFFWMIQE